MSHIFISYSHKDSEYAHKLAARLEALSLEVWIDDRIDYGSKWPQVLQEKVDTCEAFVIIMTSRAYESHWVQSELTRALDKKKPIFPLLLEGDEPWLSVQNIQYVDVRDGELPQEGFYKTLLRNFLNQAIQKGELVLVHLSRIHQGKTLISLVSDAHDLNSNYDEPQNQSEMELIRDFLSYVGDLDVVLELGGGASAEAAFSLSQQIDELELKGLFVYAGQMKGKLKTEKGVIDNWKRAIVVVSRAEHEALPWYSYLD